MIRGQNQRLWIFSRQMIEKFNSSISFDFNGKLDENVHRIERYECTTPPPIQSIIFYRIVATKLEGQ